MSRFTMCPDCGHRMNRYKDAWGNWDGETYYCPFCSGNDFDDDDDDGEGISVEDAAMIWVSNGKDEDYMFGYSEDELEEALG